jgi:flagellar biosynthetic protein FliQ
MTPQMVLDLMQESFKIALSLSLPIMLSTLSVGVAVSIVQAVTSIQEQTMVFVPKILAVILSTLICFSWMMNKVINFTHELFSGIPDMIR